VGRVADRVEVKEQPEERDGVVREADPVGSWVMNHPGDEDVDELCGEPVCELFSRDEFGQWERVVGFEASQGKDAKGRGSSDDTASEKAGDVFRLEERVPMDRLSPMWSTVYRLNYPTYIQTVRHWSMQGCLCHS